MTMDDKITPKNAEFLFCKLCDFKCSKHSDFDRHVLTPKHKRNDVGLQKDYAFYAENAEHKCDCGKSYKYRQGLFKHKHKCSEINTKNDKQHDNKELHIDTHLVMQILKSNQDLQQQMLEMLSEAKNNGTTNNTINNNSNNKSFNLQFYLNTTCKDAINLQDFIDSIDINLTDVESIGKLGFVNGISNSTFRKSGAKNS